MGGIMQEWEKESERDSKGKKRAQRDPWGQAQVFATIGSCKTSVASPNRWHNPLWGQHPSPKPAHFHKPTLQMSYHLLILSCRGAQSMTVWGTRLSHTQTSATSRLLSFFKKLSQLFKFINLLFLRVFDFPQVCVVCWAYHHTRPSPLSLSTPFLSTRSIFYPLSIRHTDLISQTIQNLGTTNKRKQVSFWDWLRRWRNHAWSPMLNPSTRDVETEGPWV